MTGRVTRWLERAPAPAFAAYAVVAAFGTYFCMYAFRRPFAVGAYVGVVHLNHLTLNHKTLFLISQIINYTISPWVDTGRINRREKR